MPKNKKFVAREVALNSLDENPDKDKKTMATLNAWAREGTLESIKKIEDFIVKTEDWRALSYAELALSEAMRIYYSPQNKQEEKEFILAKMIYDKEGRVQELMSEADEAKLVLEKMKIEREVHDELAQSPVGKKNWDDWQYCFSEDYYLGEQKQYDEAVENLAYASAWMEAARKLIKDKKYLAVPEDVWGHAQWDGDGHLFWIDEMTCPPPDEYAEIGVEDIPF